MLTNYEDTGKGDMNPNDYIKFDRVNLFDLRRQLPMKARSDKLDQGGRAWGAGKRKRAKIICNVKAGTGKITINGKPMHQYFHLPSQRYKLMLPLKVTGYSCLVDINIHARGGGTSGQSEACQPAIANALQAFDVNTRPTLKYLKLFKNDPRKVERKKPGLQKARKGQVFRRR